MSFIKKRSGFSLIELVIGLVMITAMMPAVMVVFQQVLHSKFIAEAKITAANLAQEIVDHVTQERYSDIVSLSPRSCGGADDEYRFCDPEDPSEFGRNFTYEIRLYQADPANLDDLSNPVAACEAAGDYCRIEVIVSNERVGSFRLTTLVTNSQ